MTVRSEKLWAQFDKVDLKRTSGTTYSDKSSNSEVYPHMAASAWTNSSNSDTPHSTYYTVSITQSVVLRVLEEFPYQKILPFVAKKVNKAEPYQLDLQKNQTTDNMHQF